MTGSTVAASALSPIEQVRKRPGMWVGDTADGSGIAHMVWEAVGNAVDQFLAGHCREIHVGIQPDASILVEVMSAAVAEAFADFLRDDAVTLRVLRARLPPGVGSPR